MLYHLALGVAHHAPLFQLVLDQGHGQLGAVNRHVDLLQYIGKGADMILMSMSDHKALNFVDVIFQIGDVRDHQIDSQHVVARERQSAVHHNDRVLVLKGGDVHSDLLQTAKGDDF